MKQCPRCKTALTKSHSQKMICRACGFITRDLQVARDNQQFQQRHNFNKKISIIRNNTEPAKKSMVEGRSDQAELKKHYLSCFQNLLKTAANYLSKSNKEFSNLEGQVRQIWLNYCALVVRYDANVAGMFSRLLKTQYKQNQAEHKHQQKLQPQLPQEKKQEQVQLGQFHEVEKGERKRKGRPKKQSLLSCSLTAEQKRTSVQTKARRHYKQLQTQQSEGMSLGEQRASFLQFVCKDLWDEASVDVPSIEYIANKYAILLVRQIYSGLQGGFGVAEVKGRPFKLTNKLLEGIVKMRKLNITQRKQIILILFLEDMLKEWSAQISMEDEHSLSDLLLLYDSEENNQRKPLITATIEYLKKVVDQKNYSQIECKKSLPQLSFNLVYAIIYLANLINCNTLSIGDVVELSSKSGLWLEFQGRKIENEVKVCSNKIRTTATILMKAMEIRYEPSVASLSKWVQKYAKICGLSFKMKQILKLTQALHKGMNMLKRQECTPLANGFIQQDILAKSIITIFIKLQTGFQSYPYLSTASPLLVQTLRASSGIQNRQKYIEIITKLPGDHVNISKVLDNLEVQYGSHSQRNRNLKLKFSSTNYSSIQFLTVPELKWLARKNISSNFTISINLAQSRVLKQQNRLFRAENKREEFIQVSKPLRDQLELAMQQQYNHLFRAEDLDLPSSNYEFFYEYMSNIKHAGRDLFVLFCERLAGAECRMSSLYNWIEAMEKVMIDFEN